MCSTQRRASLKENVSVNQPTTVRTDIPAASLLAFVRQTSTCAFMLVSLLESIHRGRSDRHRWHLAAMVQDDEITAILALNRLDGYCLIHGTDAADLKRLLTQLDHEHTVTTIAGESNVIEDIADLPSLATRVGREQHEHFMVLRPFQQTVEPDGNYRPAQVKDIPVLRAYAAGYSSEHNVPFNCNWEQAVAQRQVMLAETLSPDRPGEVAACLMRGVTADPFTLCSGVYTFPNFRGSGYATRLVANFCFEASLAKLSSCLYVSLTNRPAIAAYQRVGFVAVDTYRTLHIRGPLI